MMCWTGLFTTPFDRQFVKKKYATSMDWATKHLHGLQWEEGQYPYSLSGTKISHFGSTHQLYAKGHENAYGFNNTQHTPWQISKTWMPFHERTAIWMLLHLSQHCILDISCPLDKAMRLGQYYKEPVQVTALCNML